MNKRVFNKQASPRIKNESFVVTFPNIWGSKLLWHFIFIFVFTYILELWYAELNPIKSIYVIKDIRGI